MNLKDKVDFQTLKHIEWQEHNCSDQSTMLHALLYDRAMQFDKTWDSYEAPVVLGVLAKCCHLSHRDLSEIA